MLAASSSRFGVGMSSSRCLMSISNGVTRLPGLVGEAFPVPESHVLGNRAQTFSRTAMLVVKKLSGSAIPANSKFDV